VGVREVSHFILQDLFRPRPVLEWWEPIVI